MGLRDALSVFFVLHHLLTTQSDVIKENVVCQRIQPQISRFAVPVLPATVNCWWASTSFTPSACEEAGIAGHDAV